MRYRELTEPSGWRHYSGRERECQLTPLSNTNGETEAVRAHVQYGSVTTGRQRVWVGYFVQVVEQDGKEWLAEHPHSLRGALRKVEAQLNGDGWNLDAIGLDPEWRESGLSANSGFGFHPDHDGAVHMLDVKHSQTDA